jgi:DNA-binding transcriptional LysR family regulator
MKHEVSAVGHRIDLNLLVLFEAIFRARNLTAAGKGLGLSQPAMSHALSRLRWVFKDPLFVRAPRGLEPTPLAEEIAPSVSEGLATIRTGFERKRFDPATSSRIFNIAMADLSEFTHLPRVLRALRSAPGVRIRTVELTPPERRVALAEGRVDLALGNDPAERPLRGELVGEHGYKTVVRTGHPAIRNRLTLAQFRNASHLLVMPAGGAKHGEVIEKALRSARVGAEITVTIGNFFSAAAIIPQTDLIATVTPGVARAMAQMASIRMFEPPIALPRARIYLWWHERYHRDPGVAWLREIYLREVRPLYGLKA